MPVTLDALRKWTTPLLFQEGKAWFEAGKVEQFVCEQGRFEGRISVRERSQICRFSVDAEGRIRNECPCRVNREQGLICGHVIAVMLAWRAEHADPREERLARIEARLTVPAERRRHFRHLGADGTPARLEIRLRRNWAAEVLEGKRVHLIPVIRLPGERVLRPDQIPPGQRLNLPPGDQRLLLLLEELSGGEMLPPVFETDSMELPQLFSLIAPGEITRLEWPVPLRLHAEPLPPQLTVDLDEVSGELMVLLHLDPPRAAPAGSTPLLLLDRNAGWWVCGDHAWPLEAVPPPELQGLRSGPLRIPRSRVMSFLREQLPALSERMLVDQRVSADRFRESGVAPGFHLRLKGGLQFVSGVLHARYGDVEALADGPDPGKLCSLPDPADPLAYGGRNREAEREALTRLRALGFAAETGDRLGALEGQTAILNLLSRLRFELEPLGWQVSLSDQLEVVAAKAGFLLAQMEIQTLADTPEWFRLDLRLRESGGESLTEAALRRALGKGEEFLQLGDRWVLLPRAQTETLLDWVAESRPAPDGSLRIHQRSCGYLQASLQEYAGIPVKLPEEWLAIAERQRGRIGLPEVVLSDRLVQILRPYQFQGVRWLRFLEQGGFGGILADDMGLGKTLQALAWLSLSRERESARGRPALVVCPSALVQNWVEETQRFVPEFRVCALADADRAERWEKAADFDLLVVSYALLGRDIERAERVDWSAVLLDEAQHIKNPDTRNARSAKRLQADCRLVLTGTPMENQVRDLWSLMDFLMPGYLGTQAEFKRDYGARIAAGGAGADTALQRLRRKIRPFLLRRLKAEVARELPPRLERQVNCDLKPGQWRLYRELEEAVRAEVAAGNSKLAVLRGLMRLRQVCGHPALLTGSGAASDASAEESGKLEAFLELLDEVVDGGHRVLVFSQFTSMLSILRAQLEARGLAYLYLDGSTRDRQSMVHEFNRNEEIPVFLISLMAGGVGLNLTGADVVIHFDPWWNPAVEDQATDRAHRIGQTRTVYSLKLICRDTVEARVAALQTRKRELTEAALSGDEAVMERLSWEDLRALVAL